MEVEAQGCSIPKRYFMHVIIKSGKQQDLVTHDLLLNLTILAGR